MILFENALISLNYEPASDILSVDMPKVDNLNLPEIRKTLSIIVDHVRNYNVKNLLVDARNTIVEVDEETYTAMVTEFSKDLMATRLEKLARIMTPSVVRENVVKKVYEQKPCSLKTQSFTARAAAIEWLKADA